MIRFRDLPKLSPSEFGLDNMIRTNHATPCYLDTASGRIVVERPWRVTGWSDQVDERLMYGREGQVCLMLFHPEHGEFWEHYPLFDEEDRDRAVFEAKGGA